MYLFIFVNRKTSLKILIMLICNAHFIVFIHVQYNLKIVLLITGEMLHIPELDLESEVDALLSNPEVVEQLEQCVMNWQTQITIVLEVQQNKKPQAPGPFGEITFWQERASILSALSEQLKQPVVKKILAVITKAKAGIVQTLEATVAELTKHCLEAEDNLRFLSTLERYFMNLATGANLRVILENIPPLMDSLQIIWLMSHHYNTDERMVPLMERIAWQLCERVSQVIDVHTLFEYREVAKVKVHDAKEVLDQWKSSYFEMRAEIEESGRHSRWEFDRKRLFERTDYMASVCQDLYNVLQILEEFHNIFGPELTNLTGDPNHIDEMLCRIDRLVLPIKEVRFSPFSICKMSSWRMVMQDFDSAVQNIEIFSFIDQAFQTLPFSAAAFKMLLNLKHISTREAINNYLMRKFNDILAQYCKEVDSIKELFEVQKDKPPLNKSEPPVAGSIKWTRSLLHRIKQTILSFRDVPEILESEQYKVVSYFTMRDYEVKKYECWLDETERILPLLMKKPLLVTSENQVQAGTESSPQRNVRYIVNFAPEIREIISETKYLVMLDYSVPSLVQNVALQEHRFIRLLTKVKQHMDVGCRMINWNSLGISDFIKESIQAVSTFESVVSQIQKNERDIESKLQTMVTANLLQFPVPDKSNHLPGIKEFCEGVEQERAKAVNLLTEKYADIGALIIKTEQLIMKTRSGKAKSMAGYYSYWEQKVLDSLIKMLIQAFNNALMGSTPLFQIDAILSAPKIVLQPRNSEIYWLIVHCIRDCVESTKLFIRWMHGTCIECPPQRISGEDELVTFNFYSDVRQHPQINESAMTVSQNIQRLLFSVDQYLSHWKRYSPLWKENKTMVNEKFAARKPSCVMYDDKLQFFAGIKQEVMQEPCYKNNCSIHLNLEPLAHTVQETAESWINCLGSLLIKPAKEDLLNLRDEVTVLNHAVCVLCFHSKSPLILYLIYPYGYFIQQQLSPKLKQSPDTFENLKSVLGTISDIRDMSLDVEMRVTDIEERYRTLAMYKVEVLCV
uniref:Dynein heavy chain tail domain-containing protein n=1 Tax=Monopterus albus TaxID=43700 RepID=A0A3Q3JRK8_MONAL